LKVQKKSSKKHNVFKTAFLQLTNAAFAVLSFSQFNFKLNSNSSAESTAQFATATMQQSCQSLKVVVYQTDLYHTILLSFCFVGDAIESRQLLMIDI
jgi:hypothetical protein